MLQQLPQIEDSQPVWVEVRPPVSPEQMVENMRSALSRGLKEVIHCKPTGYSLSVAAGGPSLHDTYTQLANATHIAAVNGSLGFLLERGIVPTFCGVLDSNEHMKDVVEADPRVRYLVASNCHPALFDKLLDAGCKVWLWHPTPKSIGTNEGFELLKRERPGTWCMVAGGCTIGLRWVNLGYMLGYRDFHLHGLDSSFRDDKTHAYKDRRWGQWVDESSLEIKGHKTSLNFLAQVSDAAQMIERFSVADMDACSFKIYGDGLLQSCWRHWEANKDTLSPSEAFLC